MAEVWARKREIRKRNDSTANLYDERYTEEQKAKYSAALKHSSFTGITNLLDAGCGTGLFVEYLGATDLEIFGVDISIECLKIASAKFRNRKNVFLVCGDTDYMPFSEGTFDSGVAFTLIQSLPEPSRTLKEIARVLKGGAQLIISILRRDMGLDIFEALLRPFNLKLVEVVESENLKDYIAVCKG